MEQNATPAEISPATAINAGDDGVENAQGNEPGIALQDSAADHVPALAETGRAAAIPGGESARLEMAAMVQAGGAGLGGGHDEPHQPALIQASFTPFSTGELDIARTESKQCQIGDGELQPLRLASLNDSFTLAADADGEPAHKIGSSGYFNDGPRFQFALETMELADPWGDFGDQRSEVVLRHLQGGPDGSATHGSATSGSADNGPDNYPADSGPTDNRPADNCPADNGPANHAPMAIEPGCARIDENSACGTVVAHLTTRDPDHGDTHSYTLITSDSPFVIDGDVIKVKAGAQIDYETQNGYDLVVRSTDAHGNSITRNIHIGVNDVNEAPTATAIADQSVAAGAQFTLASAGHFADVDHCDRLTYSISGPAWLSIDPHTGVISGTAPADLTFDAIAISDGHADVTGLSFLRLETNFLSSDAGYYNSVGYYLADANGNPLGGAIINPNALITGEHDTFIDLSGYAGAASLGFFMIQDGQRSFPTLAGDTAISFHQVDGAWKAYAGSTLLDVDGKTVLFSDASLNSDHVDHVRDGCLAGTQTWEDELGGGDHDFNDAIFTAALQSFHLSPTECDQTVTVTATDKGGLTVHSSFELDLTDAPAAFAALRQGDAQDNVIAGSSAADILVGGAGDDTLIGGGGNDVLAGGAGDDVLHAGPGSSLMFGGQGADRFMVSDLDHPMTVHGGAGASWMDVIDVSGLSGAQANDWTLVLTQGSVLSHSGRDVTLSADASGAIQLGGDTRIAFHEIESIHY